MYKKTKAAQAIFEDFLATIDKKYVAELFVEGDKIGAFIDKNTGMNRSIQGIKYLHESYVYTIERQRFMKPGGMVKDG